MEYEYKVTNTKHGYSVDKRLAGRASKGLKFWSLVKHFSNRKEAVEFKKILQNEEAKQ